MCRLEINQIRCGYIDDDRLVFPAAHSGWCNHDTRCRMDDNITAGFPITNRQKVPLLFTIPSYDANTDMQILQHVINHLSAMTISDNIDLYIVNALTDTADQLIQHTLSRQYRIFMNHALLQHVIDFSLRQSIQHCISNSAKQQTILTLHFVKGVRYVNRLLLYADISKLIDALYREDHCLILVADSGNPFVHPDDLP